jgi:homoserine O-acetyltransferase
MSTDTLHLVQGQHSFAEEEGFALECGRVLRPVTIRYAMYGEPNAAGDNVVLVCHALSGTAEVASWWPELFDDERLFGNDRYCVIGSNILGSCYGSTGPSAVDPDSGQPYGANFPLVTVSDIVRAQRQLLDFLGIDRVKLVIGGSIGGMQALQWVIDYPQFVEHCVAIGAAPLGSMGLALNHLQRHVIRLDPKWQNGDYPPHEVPAQGLALAREIAMCSYKSAELFATRFGRNPNRNGEDPWTHPDGRFDVAGYLDYQGEKFVQRFDANSYLAISKTMDSFDPVRSHGSAQAAYGRIRAHVTLVGISSDWLFPAADVRALGEQFTAAGVQCEYHEIASSHGHDAFLAEPEKLATILAAHL